MAKHSSKHTYKFYKQRRNDPKWRDIYLAVRNKRIIRYLIVFIAIILVIAVGLAYKDNHSSSSNVKPTSNSSSVYNNSFESQSSNYSNKISAKTDVDNNTDPNEYQKTSKIGQYTVSTEELNAVKEFTYTTTNDNGEKEYRSMKVNLDNTSGDGTITDLGNAYDSGSGDIPATYAEIKTKTIYVKGSNGAVRKVKVNTAIITKDSMRYVYYAFKNNSGGISIAEITDKSDKVLYEAVSSNN